MARAIIGTGSGFGSAPKIRLDDDCTPGGRRPGSCSSAPGDQDTIVQSLPLLQVILRQRVGYDEDGIPLYDWVVLAEARAIVYEKREEWDASAGVTTITARIMLGNPNRLDFLPETAVIREVEHPEVRWDLANTAVYPERIEATGTRTWREVPGPGPIIHPAP